MSMSNTEKTVKEIRRKTRRKFSTEEKIRIVLEGLRGEMFHCRAVPQRKASTRTCITAGARTSWRPARKRLSGDTAREANTDEVYGPQA